MKDTIDYTFLTRQKKKVTSLPEQSKSELKEIMDQIVHPGDIDGFLRVIEILRTMGDTVTISANSGEVSIQCTQIMEEFTESNVNKLSEISQDVTFPFDYSNEIDEGRPVGFDNYVKTTAKVAREAIEFLHGWGDGDSEMEELTNTVDSLSDSVEHLTKVIKSKKPEENSTNDPTDI